MYIQCTLYCMYTLCYRFAFNGGSTESISGKANHAAVGRIALTMAVAAASGGLLQAIISGFVQIYKRDENYNTNEIANAVLASLVAVTGCCPFINPYFAFLIGGMYINCDSLVMILSIIVLTTLIYHLGCSIEYLLGLHDGARVFPVHGVW